MTTWITTSSSVLGVSHSITGSPCQDSVCTMQRGQWVSMVISDGAGTAKHSDKGAELVVNTFAKALIDLSAEIDNRSPGAWINDFVIEHVITTRKELRRIAGSDQINDYHCTLVACLLGNSGGFLIHIGDGAIFGGTTSKAIDGKISLSSTSFVSLPENGEYTNETYFITEGDWIKHLRITPISSADWVFLGTDGGTTLSMISDKEPKSGFVVPLLKMLVAEDDPKIRKDKLDSILNDDQANKLTGDDKTLCIAYKANIFKASDDLSIQEQLKLLPKIDVSNKNVAEIPNNPKSDLKEISKENRKPKLNKFFIIFIFAIAISLVGFSCRSWITSHLKVTLFEGLNKTENHLPQDISKPQINKASSGSKT